MNRFIENGRGSLSRLLEDVAIDREGLPYERFMKFGPEALTDAELLAILIRTGTTRHTPMNIAQMVLQQGSAYERGLGSLHHLTLQELEQIPGIGHVKAVRLKCIAELSNRISRAGMHPKRCLNSPSRIAGYYMEPLCHEEVEHILMLCLNSRYCLISEHELSRGTVNRALISPREVFLEALRDRAVYVVLIHNHPSGDPMPSGSDVGITRQVVSAGAILEIPLFDHIIIGDHRYYSFREDKTNQKLWRE